jgi:hypothetical protein
MYPGLFTPPEPEDLGERPVFPRTYLSPYLVARGRVRHTRGLKPLVIWNA